MIPTTDLHEFLRSRRSVRRFKPDPVPDSVIERVITTATFAPSAHNRQPWRFVVLADAEPKTRLADAMAADFRRDLLRDGVTADEIDRQVARSNKRIHAAPVIILLCMDTRDMDIYPDAKRRQAERTMAMQSVAAAGLQLLLAAHAEGLGGVWVCSPLFAPNAVQGALKLDKAWEPQGMFFLGYSDASQQTRERKLFDEVTLFR